MNFLKKLFFVVFISLFIFLIIINIFKPILFATNLIFPYSISKFDIVLNYPILWRYIKIIFCITWFFNIFLSVNSILKFISIKFNGISKKITKKSTCLQNGNFNILIGFNYLNHEKIYIPEKGLYQNILVTGTIGSRENCFCSLPYS